MGIPIADCRCQDLGHGIYVSHPSYEFGWLYKSGDFGYFAAKAAAEKQCKNADSAQPQA